MKEAHEKPNELAKASEPHQNIVLGRFQGGFHFDDPLPSLNGASRGF